MSQPLDVQRLARTLHEILIRDTLRAGPMHGYMIAGGIKERTGGHINIRHGTLYPVLHHLERQALIAGSWVEGHGRRRRKVYILAAAGWVYLKERAVEWRELQRCLVTLLSDGQSVCPAVER
ncbi:MAG: helix-turn-helix transcriptional regulator [Gemmatimonadetes bacterium]|jgi:DNA-binding PadR family transcriptional regulator|nr:helix-turn-helix transcriptional regulator [Gemmatimonadota bacterium]